MPFPTTGVLDRFTNTNGTDLPAHSANWALPNLTGYFDLEIQGNQATGTLTDAFGIDYWTANFGPNTEVFVTLAGLVNGTAMELFVRLREETVLDALDGYVLDFTPAAGADNDAVTHYRADNNVYTQLGAVITAELAAGAALGLEVIGSTLQAYHRDVGGSWTVLDTTRTDTTYAAAGKIALLTISTVVRFDDFGGGTVGVPERTKMGVGPYLRAVGASQVGRPATRRQWLGGMALRSLPWERWCGWIGRKR